MSEQTLIKITTDYNSLVNLSKKVEILNKEIETKFMKHFDFLGAKVYQQIKNFHYVHEGIFVVRDINHNVYKFELEKSGV